MAKRPEPKGLHAVAVAFHRPVEVGHGDVGKTLLHVNMRRARYGNASRGASAAAWSQSASASLGRPRERRASPRRARATASRGASRTASVKSASAAS